MAAAAVPTPASSETRAPQTRRLRRSRPNSSVPRGCPGVPGALSRLGVSTASGSGSGSQGAASAAMMASAMATSATTARRFRRRSRRMAVLELDPRVQPRIERVHREVDQHEGERDDQHAALHERHVAGQDALDHQGAHAGPGEHGLGEDGAAQQIARLHAHHGDDGDERVLQRVPPDHHALAQALGARGADIVLAERLQHGGAREPGDDGDRRRRERHRGQHEMGEEVAQPAAAIGRVHARGGQPAQPEREDHHQHDAQPEHRHARPEERGDARRGGRGGSWRAWPRRCRARCRRGWRGGARSR